MSSPISKNPMQPITGELRSSSEAQVKKGDPLETYRTEQCHGNIDATTMQNRIAQGKALMSRLTGIKFGSDEWHTFVTSHVKNNTDSAISLMWFLTAKAVKQGDSYTAGSMRIANGQDPEMGKKMAAFLKEAGPSYARWSTHMNENLKKGESAFGLDIPHGLPGPEKRTILFAAQPDGSIFIKLEERGFPGFGSLKKAKESFLHLIDWIKTRPAKIFGQHAASRKEHVPKSVVKTYQKVMEFLFKEKSTFSKLIEQRLTKEGKTYGIRRMESKMKKIIQHKKNEISKLPISEQIAFNKIHARYEQAINPFLNRARERGFSGDFKGDEVTLAITQRDFE